MKYFSVISFFVFLLQSCIAPDCRLQIANQSNDTITFVVSKDSIIDCKNLENAVIRNDTVYISSLSKQLHFFYYYIPPKSSDNMCFKMGKRAWEDYVKFENERVYIFFIGADKIKRTSESVLLPCELPFKRQSYTFEDLKNNNWTITYPEK
jgi:hypothetical protein